MAGTTFSQFTPVSAFPNTSGQENKVLIAQPGGNLGWDVVPILAGGTGQTTAQAGLDALTKGHLNLTGVGARIRGDFSSSTIANRTLFQTTTPTAATHVGIAPNGVVVTGNTASAIELEDITSVSGNGSILRIENRQGAEMRISSTARGSGSYLPLTFYVNNIKTLTLNTSGAIGVGPTASYGDAYQVLMSNGPTATPTWTSALTALTSGTGGSGTIPLNVGGTGIAATSNDDLITQLGVKAYVQTAGKNSQGNKTVQSIANGVPSNSFGSNGDIIYQY
jgi:hypothetical protein